MKRAKRKKGRGYLDRILSMKSLPAGGIYHIDVAHDAWCDLLNHRSSECNCNPTIGDALCAIGQRRDG